MFKKRFAWGITYGLALTGFTAYALLDTFVLSHVYQTVQLDNSVSSYNAGSSVSQGSGTVTAQTTAPADDPADTQAQTSAVTEAAGDEEADTQTEAASGDHTEPVVTANSYSDGNISIIITQYREYDTDIYVADIQLSSPEYLKTALANGAYGKNVTAKTSEIASQTGAILAINGDFYGARESGYVVRQGQLLRDSSGGSEDLVIYSDGTMQVIDENSVSASQLVADGAQQVLSFGPGIVIDGQIAVDENDEVGKAMASNPRTAIGQIDGLHYVMVVSDGRTSSSAGLSLKELAEVMQSLGCTTAYNLDGGGSSTMVFNGTIINNPTTGGRHSKERSVSDIVYIGQ